jgi:hypothetical protein
MTWQSVVFWSVFIIVVGWIFTTGLKTGAEHKPKEKDKEDVK